MKTMMKTRFSLFSGPIFGGLAIAATCAAVTLPVAAQAPSVAMLNALAKGAWTLRNHESGSTRKVCVRSGRELIQLRHPQPGCNLSVVSGGDREVTAQYTCPGDGYGRTTIRYENDDLVQISTQGIQGGKPFSTTYEARHTGPCN